LSELRPTDAQGEEPDLPPDGAKRQIALLRAEIRRLSTQLRRELAEVERLSAQVEASLARNQELEAGFAIALGERDRILASKAWRATRAMQQAIRAPSRVLSPLIGLTERLRTHSIPPTAELMPSRPAEPDPSAVDEYEQWVDAYDTLSPDDRTLIAAQIDGFRERPVISLVLSNEGASETLLQKTTASIRKQLYPAWELCLSKNKQVNGAFIACVEPGDLLTDHALYEIAAEILANPEASIIYTDEDKIDGSGRRHDPVFKPDFSIELQLGYHLTGRLTVYRRSLLEAIGISPSDIGLEQQQALAAHAALRCGSARIRHIQAILCHRLVDENLNDVAAARQLETDANVAAIARQMGNIRITPLSDHAVGNAVTWTLPNPLPRVSVIIPTRDRADLLTRAVTGLLYRTDYPDIEVLILDNDSVEAGTLSLFQLLRKDSRVRVIPISGPFNYSAINNAGVRAATGDILVLLNNDVDVIESGWLKELVSHAVRPDVGAVGAKLIFGDGRIQHAGVVLGVGCHNGGPGVAGHFGLSAEESDEGYLGQFALTRELSAVTGACLAVRRDVFEAVGGLNETELPVSFNDVDFCLRLRTQGYRIIWTPFAELYHLESASRGRPDTPEQVARAAREADYMRERWGPILDNDPFYNLNFDRKNHQFELARPPNRKKPWRL
jgi:O-antigen biosynthesis protein